MLARELRIENFKRFERLDVGLGPFDCLVGPNNSGKTTLLQGLALLDFCLHHCLSSKDGRWRLKNRSISPEEFYVLPVSSPVDLWTDRRTQTREGHIRIGISAVFDANGADKEVTARIDLNYNRFSVSVDTEDQGEEWLERLAGVRISYLPVFSMFLPQEERRTSAVIEDELARGRVSAVIRNLLLDLKHQQREEELVGVLQRAFPALAEMAIQFDQANDRYISVTYKEEGRPKELDVFSAGSGFQQFLYLFGFILLRQPSLILLDEPDAHLHGTLQRALLDELRRFVDQGRQVLFATHSRELISQMPAGSIVTLDNAEAKRLAVAFDVYDVLDRLGALDPTQLPAVQAYRRVLVVEDQADWDILSAFCATVLLPAAWSEVERRLALCYAKGNPWKQDMARLRDQLGQVISLQAAPLEMFVVADRDYYPDRDGLLEALPADRIRWHVWERAEIENYLLCPSAILRALREGGTAPPLAEALFSEGFAREYERLTESARNSAHDHLVEAFGEFNRRSNGERWAPAKLSRNARQYLDQRWSAGKLELADAKDIVLPGLKRWLQQRGLGQFSNRVLARSLHADELPDEIHRLARRLADFAGVRSPV